MSLSTNSISPTNFTLVFIAFSYGLDLTFWIKSQASKITLQNIFDHFYLPPKQGWFSQSDLNAQIGLNQNRINVINSSFISVNFLLVHQNINCIEVPK